MGIYGSVGFTRRDKTPAHWQKDFRMKPSTKQELAQIERERERLITEFKALPDDISDEEYTKASKLVNAKLDALIDRADKMRRANK